MVPKTLLTGLIVFWISFLLATISTHLGCFGSWIAYPLFFLLITIAVKAWFCLIRLICNFAEKTNRFRYYAFSLLTLTFLSVAGYVQWHFKPSQNITATVDSGMYFATAHTISSHGSYKMQVEWPSETPESLKNWWLGQNNSEAQRRIHPGPKYWNFMVGYFFLDQDKRSGSVANPFPQGYPTLLASALKVGGPPLAFGLNTIIHLVSSALLGLLAVQFTQRKEAGIVAFLMLFFPLSVWSANHLYAEGLLVFAWLSSVLAWSYRKKIPTVSGLLLGVSLGLSLLIKIDALLGMLSFTLILLDYRKHRKFVLIALTSFLLCAGWSMIGNTAFAVNYIKDTLYALWETAPSTRYPQTAIIGLLLIFIFVWIAVRQRFAHSRWIPNLSDRPPARFLRQLLPWLLITVFVYLYFIRPDPMHPDTFLFPGTGKEIRSYREETFFRLSWFFSPALLWLSLAGISFMVWRINTSWQIAFYICGLLSLLFFAYDIRCDPYQPYCMRRFATYTNPFLLIGIASGLIALFELKKLKAISSLLVPLFILSAVIFFVKGAQIQKVSEMEGLFDEISALAKELPDDGIILIPKRSRLSHFSAPLRFIFEKEIFNVRTQKRSNDYVETMQSYLSQSKRPIYLLTTSPVDFLGFPANDSILLDDGCFQIRYRPKNYDSPHSEEKEIEVRYYLFQISNTTCQKV